MPIVEEAWKMFRIHCIVEETFFWGRGWFIKMENFQKSEGFGDKWYSFHAKSRQRSQKQTLKGQNKKNPLYISITLHKYQDSV